MFRSFLLLRLRRKRPPFSLLLEDLLKRNWLVVSVVNSWKDLSRVYRSLRIGNILKGLANYFIWLSYYFKCGRRFFTKSPIPSISYHLLVDKEMACSELNSWNDFSRCFFFLKGSIFIHYKTMLTAFGLLFSWLSYQLFPFKETSYPFF